MARYDSRTTTFSPEGRLFQVEYAVKAIENAGSCIGIKSSEGIVLATERRDLSKLLANNKNDKLYPIDEHIYCAVAGLTADANVLVSYLRRVAQDHRSTFDEPQPLAQLLTRICDLKQGYTQIGGQRPFGVSFIYAGYDYNKGLQLCTSDPAGNFHAWNACAIGKGTHDVNALLKEDFAENGVKLAEAKYLVVKAFKKLLDTSDDLHRKIDCIVLKPNKEKETLESETVDSNELLAIIQRLDEEAAQAEAN